jgi:hypothetical protein
VCLETGVGGRTGAFPYEPAYFEVRLASGNGREWEEETVFVAEMVVEVDLGVDVVAVVVAETGTKDVAVVNVDGIFFCAEVEGHC